MENLWPYIWTLLGLVVTVISGKYMAGKANHDRILAYDKIADDMLAAIRLNNPGNVLLEKVQFYEDKLVAALLAAPQTTNNPEVIHRLAAGAISRAVVDDGAVLDDAVKKKSK
jgi:hypothetical protein